LQIEIFARAWDWWTGTAAQLQAEGLIPDGFEWPRGKAHFRWTCGAFEFWLLRTRPKGHKGPQSSWIELDSWALRRSLVKHQGTGLREARIYEAEQAHAEMLYRKTAEYQAQFFACLEAEKDKAYQTFRKLIVPAKRKGRRPARGVGS
jgi:hypothetical protein